jgi:hypothetical protein
MALKITRKTRTILLIILGVLVIAGGGFLIWRVNQEETVAPDDSDASSCPDGCYWHNTIKVCTGSGGCVDYGSGCSNGLVTRTAPDGSKWCCVPCSEHDGDGRDCACGTDVRYCDTCGDYQSCINKYGSCGCHGWGDDYPCSEYGVCGTRHGDNYGSTQTSWSSGTFCERGTVVPSNPSFPEPGKTTTWKCSGKGATVNCTARREGLSIYTVIYDPNGGNCTPDNRPVEYGKTSAAPKCTRSGYNVAGFTRISGSGGNLNRATGAITNVSGNQTIQVSWSESCGDGTCAAGENAENCPVDCPANCGDGFCSIPDENANNCLQDCPSDCGDGLCTEGEDAENCSVDCPADCGDGFCSTPDENANNCLRDCPSNCGDGLCTEGEDTTNCSIDCGEPIAQGNTVPETGIFDTVISKISLGISFIFLGGLVSQYSRINYLFNSISERQQFRREVKKQRRNEEKMVKRREKMERRFK